MREVRQSAGSDGRRRRPPGHASRYLLVLTVVALLCAATATRALSADQPVEALREQLAEDIRALSSLPEGSRLSGYPGAKAARDYIVKRLHGLGIERVYLQEFPVVVPVTRGVSLRVGGTEVTAYPLWPNGIRTCTTPGTITGPIIFGGRSFFSDYDGKDVPGSVVLLDGDRSVDWINGPSFGAKAVLFIEPEDLLRYELEQKFSDIPLNAPRFWIPRQTGLELRRRVEGAEQAGKPLEAEISCNVAWEERKAWNILAFLPGSDPNEADRLNVVQTYYDAVSIVPDLAPGAESAGNVAAVLSLAEVLLEDPPHRPMMLLFTAGHFQSLAGMRWFTDLVKLDREKLDAEIKRLEDKAIRKDDRLADYEAMRELFAPVRQESVEDYDRVAEVIGRMEQDVLTARHQRDKYTVLYDVLKKYNDKSFFISLKTSVDRYESKDRSTEADRLKYLRLVGHRKFLQEVDSDLKKKLAFGFCFDLSSQSSDLGIFHKGHFIDQGGTHNEAVLRRAYADIGFRAADLAGELLGPNSIIDGINQPTGRVWKTYFPSPIALESELMTLTGLPAVTFATANDNRVLVDTPADRLENMKLENLLRQVAELRVLLPAVMNDRRTALAIDDIRKDEVLEDWGARVVGRAVMYDASKSLGVADVPVPGSVVTCRQNPGPYSRGDVWKTLVGVRPGYVQLADGAGNFEFLIVPRKRALPWDHASFLFEAFRTDPGTGYITFAPDKGDHGEKAFPTDVPITVAEKDVTVVVFKCVPVAVFDLLDQRSYNMFSTVALYDARTDSAPFSFGYKVAGKITDNSYVEPVGVLFLPAPTKDASGIRFKATFGSGVAGTKFALLNAPTPSKKDYNGIGYQANEPTAIINTPYLMARDIWNLDEYRLEVLRTHGVRNDKVEALHTDARKALGQAGTALQERRYGAFVRHSRAAWGYEARAYPSVEGTTTDITTGVLFFLFLLLPVSHFGERLLFGFPDVNRQILGFFGIFLVMFLILAMVHPAFGVTSGGPIILLAFVTVALSVLVISMIRARFEVEIQRLQQRPGQGPRADVNRSNAAKQAFLLGIANMRRRKMRTTLTITTLTVLMFSVLSLTSIEPKLVVKRRSLQQDIRVPYQGVLIRNVTWGTLTDQVYKGVLNQFVRTEAVEDHEPTDRSAPVLTRSGSIVAPRAWYVSQSRREPTAVEVTSLDEPGRAFIASGVVGLSSLERYVTHPQELLVTPQKWFSPEDRDVCIVSQKMANVLGIDPAQVTGEVADAPRVRVFGRELAVVGIFDDEKLMHYRDIDEETLSPVDYQEESWQKHAQIRRDPTELYHYVHLDPRNCLWTDYSFLMAQGGTLRSLVYVPADPAKLRKQVENDLLRRHTISAFVALGDEAELPTGPGGPAATGSRRRVKGDVVFATSVGETAISGIGNILVPLAISALIVFNTMLGAVYERTREIWIYGSVGLSPMHIGSLFMAESCVFATVSTVIGYLVGQIVARLVTQQGLLEGLSLNYSSYSAIYSACFTMGIVLLSTLYPARKASQMSVPDIERIWKFPEPQGDLLIFDFPFTMSGEQALGVSIHLLHCFQDHDSQSVGDFFTAGSRLWAEEADPKAGEDKLTYHLASTVWIAPFDFGISQRLHMVTEPSEDPGIFLAKMHIERLSGQPSAWVRMNHRFLKLIRKQFLVWRLFSVAERQYYINEAKRMLGLPVPEQEEVSETPAGVIEGPEPAPAGAE